MISPDPKPDGSSKDAGLEPMGASEPKVELEDYDEADLTDQGEYSHENQEMIDAIEAEFSKESNLDEEEEGPFDEGESDIRMERTRTVASMMPMRSLMRTEPPRLKRRSPRRQSAGA
jgi:hypothetical protein